MADRSRGSRQTKFWSNMTLADQVGLTTVQGIIGSVTIAELSGPKLTLLRSRGRLLLTSVPASASASTVVGLGLIVVSANALAVGGTSVPGPLNDQGAAWLWHSYFGVDAAHWITAVSNAGFGALEQDVMIDAKAMRKVEPDQSVALIGELSSSDFSSVEVTGGLRFLFGQG